jgi:hypothetical protein
MARMHPTKWSTATRASVAVVLAIQYLVIATQLPAHAAGPIGAD